MASQRYFGQAPNPCGKCYVPDRYRFLKIDGGMAVFHCDNCGEFSLPISQCAGIIELTEA